MAVTYRDQPTPWPHLLLILTTCLFLIVRKDGKQALAKFQQTKCTAKGAGKKGKSNHTWQLFFFFDPQKYLLTSTVLSFHHDFPMFALPVWHAINCCPDPACYAPVTPCLHCLPGTRQWVGMHGSVKPELHPTTAHISAGGGFGASGTWHWEHSLRIWGYLQTNRKKKTTISLMWHELRSQTHVEPNSFVLLCLLSSMIWDKVWCWNPWESRAACWG